MSSLTDAGSVVDGVCKKLTLSTMVPAAGSVDENVEKNFNTSSCWKCLNFDLKFF
jgi:hypothetical protein